MAPRRRAAHPIGALCGPGVRPHSVDGLYGARPRYGLPRLCGGPEHGRPGGNAARGARHPRGRSPHQRLHERAAGRPRLLRERGRARRLGRQGRAWGARVARDLRTGDFRCDVSQRAGLEQPVHRQRGLPGEAPRLRWGLCRSGLRRALAPLLCRESPTRQAQRGMGHVQAFPGFVAPGAAGRQRRMLPGYGGSERPSGPAFRLYAEPRGLGSGHGGPRAPVARAISLHAPRPPAERGLHPGQRGAIPVSRTRPGQRL